jgi:lysophospholipase L1-like esterase
MPGRLHYLALGDSYTIGEGVPRCLGWPAQLRGLLDDDGLQLQPAQIIATTGWTTDELHAGIDAQPLQGPYDLVTLLIGVNNQYRGRPLPEYREQFASLLDRAIALAGNRPPRVLVLSIPDWGVTPFAHAHGHNPEHIGRAIDAFNAAAAALCDAREVVFIDITGHSRAHGQQAQMLADDALHPSAAMYADWAALALPAAQHALRSG